jgi:hypothetical protein
VFPNARKLIQPDLALARSDEADQAKAEFKRLIHRSGDSTFADQALEQIAFRWNHLNA